MAATRRHSAAARRLRAKAEPRRKAETRSKLGLRHGKRTGSRAPTASSQGPCAVNRVPMIRARKRQSISRWIFGLHRHGKRPARLTVEVSAQGEPAALRRTCSEARRSGSEVEIGNR